MTLTSGQPKLPLRLGRYEVGATLAGGGMARVLVGRTWNDDGSERLVALIGVIGDEDPRHRGAV